MAVTIKDVLNLEIMKNFKVIAGDKGLDKTVIKTEILDFEFVCEGEEYRPQSFDGDSVVLSSLLFAKDRPDLLIPTIEKLMSFNVHALAYKPVIFKELPQEVIDYANKRQFPILEFGNDEFFEDIIFEISRLNQTDDSIGNAEKYFDDIISSGRAFNEQDISNSWEKINNLFRPYVRTCVLKEEESNESEILDKLKKVKPSENLTNRVFIGKHLDRYVIILSADEPDILEFEKLLENIILIYGLPQNKLTKGVSQIYKISEGFEISLLEAYWAEKIAEIEEAEYKEFKDIGIYKLIIPQINSNVTIDYMNNYLSPILDGEEKEGELLKTAIEFTLSNGDVIKTSEKMFCHKNTIRYRLGKLQERLDPKAKEIEFYENLSAAIRIFLLKEKK